MFDIRWKKEGNHYVLEKWAPDGFEIKDGFMQFKIEDFTWQVVKDLKDNIIKIPMDYVENYGSARIAGASGWPVHPDSLMYRHLESSESENHSDKNLPTAPTNKDNIPKVA